MGRARLIAAADRGNTFTGFAGSEIKKNLSQDTARDDRTPDKISYAASNLVKPELQSRARQQSEPPINRNLFPPTPPPDSDQNRPILVTAQTSPPSTEHIARPAPTTRANSVRNGGGPIRNNSVRQVAEDPIPPLPVQERPRLGTIRTASEPRGPPSRYNSTRSQRDQNPRSARDPPRERLFRETTREEDNEGDADVDEYPDELYDLYRNTAYSNPYTSNSGSQKRGSSRTRRRSHSRPRNDYIDENEEAQSPSVHSSLDEFEILNNAGGQLSRPMRDESRARGSTRRTDVRTIRVKVHHGDDTRYLMVSTGIMYEEFLDRVREKMALQTRFKIKTKDEGDLITMGDRDDWELTVQTVRRDARKTAAEMGKLEANLSLSRTQNPCMWLTLSRSGPLRRNGEITMASSIRMAGGR